MNYTLFDLITTIADDHLQCAASELREFTLAELKQELEACCPNAPWWLSAELERFRPAIVIGDVIGELV